MKKNHLTLFLIVIIVFNNCSTFQDKIGRHIERAACNLNKPGFSKVKDTSETMEEYSCAYGSKMKFYLIDSDLKPSIVQGGTDLCHRVTYALCPSELATSYKAKIERVVIYRGNRVATYSSNKDLKPGTWDIDVKIPVPEDAKPGTYSVKTIIHIGNKIYEKVSVFNVMKK